jgi:molecular chaperone DnaJ
MNIKEAYSILEIPETTSPEEAKKKYRKLTKQYHPDVNKEPGAEDKFKKINEAYQVVSSGKSTDREDLSWQSNINPFNTNVRRKHYQADNIQLHTTISFAESVLGCSREIKISRKNKCKDCDGQGETSLNNGCTKCGGRGQIVGRQGNTIMVQTCDKCGGRTQKTSCKHCNGNGVLDVESSVNVSIPGGILDSNVLRLSGMGHYVGNFMMMEQYTDAHLHVKVTADNDLKIEGKDVVFTLEVSLLDALKGCQREVRTIKGSQDVQVPVMSKNKEEIVIKGLGVGGTGNQRIVLNVQYPDDVSEIINVLNNSPNYKVN